MKSIEVLLLLILVIPILCSNEKREKISKRYSRVEKAEVMEKKSNKAETTYVLPESPLHLSGGSYLITDESINVVMRRKHNYRYWTFSYKSSKNEDNTTSLSDITINEDKSKFLFSSSSGSSGCEGIENDKEYSYKEIKDKCGEDSEVKLVVSRVQSATKIECKEYDEDGEKYKSCKIDDDYETYLGEHHEIKYKLSNIKRETYSPSTEFYDRYYIDGIETNEKINSAQRVAFQKYLWERGEIKQESLRLSIQNVTVIGDEEYTEVEYESDQDYIHSSYYVCLASDCQYICEVYNYENGYDDWDIFKYPCNKKYSNFNNDFNNAVNNVYAHTRDYNPNSNNLRRLLLKEEKNKKGELTVSAKGYYYENIDGFGYVGYFIIDNELTIIKQRNDRDGQENVMQLKLVLTLDEITNSVKIEDLEDSNINQEKSGVEARYYEGYSDEICKSFIPLKDVNNPKYEPCDVSYILYYLSQYYNIMNKEYNISESESSEIILKIHDIENEYDSDETFTLSEYDSTKLKEIVSRITKFTQPIPNNKCLKENITEDNHIFSTSLYNQVFYIYEYYVDNSREEIAFTFGYSKYKDFYRSYYLERKYINIDDDHYLSSNRDDFLHKYVDFEGNEYVECNEKLKSNVLKEIQDRINEVKKDIGIDDGSVEYMINIFLIALLLIIFI